MTTYQVGAAPSAAPYVYELDHLGFVGRVYRQDGTVDEELTREIERPATADRVLRALHLAKLAEDYAKAVDALCHQALSDAAEAIIKAVKS